MSDSQPDKSSESMQEKINLKSDSKVEIVASPDSSSPLSEVPSSFVKSEEVLESLEIGVKKPRSPLYNPKLEDHHSPHSSLKMMAMERDLILRQSTGEWLRPESIHKSHECWSKFNDFLRCRAATEPHDARCDESLRQAMEACPSELIAHWEDERARGVWHGVQAPYDENELELHETEAETTAPKLAF